MKGNFFKTWEPFFKEIDLTHRVLERAEFEQSSKLGLAEAVNKGLKFGKFQPP